MKINNQKIELMAAKQGMTVTDLAKSMKMTSSELQHSSPPWQLQSRYGCTHWPAP
ncbi:MAG: hypothetical protein ACLS45_00730 [Subdoligranulum sp.]